MTYIEKYITNEDNNIMQLLSQSIYFMTDILFCRYLMSHVLLLLSPILYDL